jgi:hypothetical protein
MQSRNNSEISYPTLNPSIIKTTRVHSSLKPLGSKSDDGGLNRKGRAEKSSSSQLGMIFPQGDVWQLLWSSD